LAAASAAVGAWEGGSGAGAFGAFFVPFAFEGVQLGLSEFDVRAPEHLSASDAFERLCHQEVFLIPEG